MGDIFFIGMESIFWQFGMFGCRFPSQLRTKMRARSCRHPPRHFARHGRSRHAARGVSLLVTRRVERDGAFQRGRVEPIVDVDVFRRFSDRSAPSVGDERFRHRSRRATTRRRARGVRRVRARGCRRLARGCARLQPRPVERRFLCPARSSTRLRRRLETRCRFPRRARRGRLLRAGR